MLKRFKDTLCGKARTWLENLRPEPTVFNYTAATPDDDKVKTLKYIFLKRWQVKGHTPEALYSEWQNLRFDPHKDDIEDFCNDVKNLADRLGYPEEAQVMAIKTTIPPCLVTHCFSFKNLAELKNALVILVDNPVIKKMLKAEPSSTEKALAPFNMGMMQWNADDEGFFQGELIGGGSQTEQTRNGRSNQIGKLFNKVDNLEFRMRKMSVADPRNRETKYKPQIVPPRRGGGGNSSSGRGRNYTNNSNSNSNGYGSQMAGSRGSYRNKE